MKILKLLLTFDLLLLTLCTLAQSPDYIPGYQNKIKGEDLNYHSPHANVNQSLLVRSEDSLRSIEWETALVPTSFTGDSVRFIFMAGIDVNPGDKHRFDFYINDQKYFSIYSPDDTIKKFYEWRSGNATLTFEVLMIDKYDDQMGYMVLTVPFEESMKVKSQKLKVRGETAGSRTWFMVYKKAIQPEMNIVDEQAVIRESGNTYQQLRIDIVHLGQPADAVILAGALATEIRLKKGYNVCRFKIPEVLKQQQVGIKVKLDAVTLFDQNHEIKPVSPVTVYLIHHSHNDIGYTHVQDEVLQKQFDNLERAIALAEATQNYPESSRFKWNAEVMWAIDEYLRTAEPEKRQKMIMAIQKGWIDLGAFYANLLFGLCNEEELIRSTESARKVARECGIPLESAMISDIPGWNWGMIPVLAKSGVKYLSLGTNQGHRIGYTLRDWADKPFYWLSPSGKEKILTWIHGQGYSLFHTGLGYNTINREQAQNKIMEYIESLSRNNYSYDIVTLRYSIGSDNGPPDEYLSEFVKDWNEHYVTPKLVISTVSESFRIFEDKYGKQIPSLSGDFTGFWEDGAASTALETAMNQANAERLVQAETLWAMLAPEKYPSGDFEEAWRYVLLYDEHTWGSWNSISEPESEFTLQQWGIKRSFALTADSLSKKLLFQAISTGGYQPVKMFPQSINVFNTLPFERDGFIRVPSTWLRDGSSIVDQNGNPLLHQRLSSLEVLVKLPDIPAMSMVNFSIQQQDFPRPPFLAVSDTLLSNGIITIRIDKKTGCIQNIRIRGQESEKLFTSGERGLNDYIYVAGRDPSNSFLAGKANLKFVEKGPLYISVEMNSTAPGSSILKRRMNIYRDANWFEILNILNKVKEYDPEGVHFAFPFTLQDSRTYVDLPYSGYVAEKEQIKGSNKNYFTANRYIDLSNSREGITITSLDAPLWEIGKIGADATVTGWFEEVAPDPVLYSYVMNNYWETNYAAGQEGKVQFRYYVKPHSGFDKTEALKFSLDRTMPLLSYSSSGSGSEGLSSLFTISNDKIIVTGCKPSYDGTGIIIRLFNTSESRQQCKIVQNGSRFTTIYSSNFDEDKLLQIDRNISIEGKDFTTILLSQ